MTRRHSEEQIVQALRQAGCGVTMTKICLAQRQVLDGQCALGLRSRDQGAEDDEEQRSGSSGVLR
jgi:hypothetical protein